MSEEPRISQYSNARLELAVITDILDEEYGPFTLTPNNDPLAELIATILSQHTSDVNTARSYRSLRETFPTWDDLANAEIATIVEAIRTGGLANSKAPRIQEVVDEIKHRTGDYQLDNLNDLSIDEAKRWLTSLHGVGPKTAACVLLFALGRPVMPVDTHVHRISQRLGFVGARTSATQTEDVLEDLLGDNADRVYVLHKGLIAHGKTVCKARSPQCEACSLRNRCDYYSHLA